MSTGEAHPARARSATRRLLVQALYQWQLSGIPAGELYEQLDAADELERVDADYFRQALEQICGSATALDAELGRHSDIAPGHLDPVEHAILYVGVWELSTRPDVPYRVVINEAVQLAKRFGATESHRYVNAVLDRASRQHRAVERGEVA